MQLKIILVSSQSKRTYFISGTRPEALTQITVITLLKTDIIIWNFVHASIQRCAFVLFLITLLFVSQVHWAWRVQREFLRHKSGLDTFNPLKEESVPAGCPASCEWHILSHHPCTVFLACFGNYLSQKQIALLLYLKISSLAYVTINLHSNAISQLLTNWVNDESCFPVVPLLPLH